MELQKALESRRSTRAFTERKLTRAEIEKLLRAATLAPSACNMQSWYFYVLADEAERAKLKGICADWIASAPVVFIVCTDRNGIVSRFGSRAEKFPVQDTALAMENLLLKAADMGLGGCIIGAYKQEECTKAFNIPENHRIVALLPVGEPAREIPATERKPLAEVSSYIGAVPEDGEADTRKPEAKQTQFRHTSLPAALFEGVNMRDAVFDGVDMSNAAFRDVDMSNAVFGDADFDPGEDENIEEAEGAVNFSGAKFCGVNMATAAFDGAVMTRSRLNHCSLEESVLTDVRMAGAKLYDIDLDGGDLSGVNMVGARIQCSNLYGASVKNCCFAETHLENCDIDGLTIDDVNVKEAIEAYLKAKAE